MKNRMKINVAAVLLAVVMMCLVPFKIYAAEAPTIDSAFSNVTSYFNDIQLSNYYIHSVLNDDDSYVFFTSDFSEKYKNFCIVYESDVNRLVMYKYDNSILDNCVTNDKVRYGVVYNSTDFGFKCHVSGDLNWYGILFDISSFSSLGFPDCFTSFDTNIPLFDSKDSAQAYYETGDTSGLLNGDNFSSYDSNIEVPQNLKVEFSAANLFDNDKGAMNLCDFNISWSQSEDVDLSNYQTEIYMQPTVKFIKAPYVGQHWQSQLGKKVLVSSATTSVSNSVNISSGNLVNYFIDATAEVTSEGVVDGSVAYYNSPLYVYVRNVVGNKYSDWVKVTITPDSVTTEGTKIFGNGSGVVSSGYEQIKGDSSKGGGVGEAIGGSSASDSSYGKGYYIDISDADLSSISGHLKSGFGILGDNGLLSLLRDFFSFIPDDYFTVLVTFISGCCAIGLLFLFLRR